MTSTIRRHRSTTVTRRTFVAGAAAGAVVLATPLRHARAVGPLKVGILLPRSGPQAQFGIDCQRGADVAPAILKAKGFPDMEYVLADTETNVQVARAQAEKLINEGVHVLVGAFDSGASTAIAQVAEQKGVPFVINIAAAPAITEQGFKYVFRNFPTGKMIAADCFKLQKELFADTGKAPKTVVMLHVNDTFGTTQRDATLALAPRFDMPYKIVDTIGYDLATRDLSVEVAKAKASGAEALWVISRLNDAILLTREMIKQRWEPMGILSTGPGWYEDAYMQALGKYSDDVISFLPWYDPNKPMTKLLKAEMAKRFPNVNLNTNQSHTFEAILIVADAYKRANSTDPKALQEALLKTNITDNVTAGPGVSFQEGNQNHKTLNSAVQDHNGGHVVVYPKSASDGKAIWPMRGWQQRG
ncbi:MAG TPA: ABC transporter substrate-binding protein [Alphaproteobacteria bacterium]|jgi:branched-chain amino acid transport system substrate-binding protein